VTRKHDSWDRRMMLVHLTPKGHAALQDVLPGHFRQMAAQMAPLSEQERKTLVRLLSKLAGDPASSHIESRGHSAVETA
jgi:DNA-binding MarR family transcriptional regulator